VINPKSVRGQQVLSCDRHTILEPLKIVKAKQHYTR